MLAARILVVDDDELLRSILVERLERSGHDVAQAGRLADARSSIEAGAPDIAFLDVKLPDGEGTELLAELSAKTECACILMTAHATVRAAVDALHHGALDYIEKPFTLDRIDATLNAALEVTALRREVRALRERAGAGGRIVGDSAPMRELMVLVTRVAAAEGTTVLIEGETGTGKGVLARAIHGASPRAAGPFVNVTCSAIAETLMESELFGHEKGAFTDARAQKRGLVELADRGTLFLDEIGELSLRMQGRLLEFIEAKSFRRVGGTRDLKVDARVVAATNRDLEAEVEAGRFRADLFYRLRVVPIHIPPLRERLGDVERLAKYFIHEFNREFGRSVRSIEPDALERLEAHEWPGNVRELRNVIERGVLLADGPALTAAALPPVRRSRTDEGPRLGPKGLDFEELERRLLEEALRRAGGNRTQAGRLLGMSRHQIRNRLLKYGLE